MEENRNERKSRKRNKNIVISRAIDRENNQRTRQAKKVRNENREKGTRVRKENSRKNKEIKEI